MVSEEGCSKIVNFLTPGVGVLVLRCGHISNIVKINYFYENLLFYSQAQIRQTEGIVMIQGRVHKNSKFHDPQDRDSCDRSWPNKSYTENALFL